MEDLRDSAFVYIIESPSDKDILDGKTEGQALVSALELAGINCYYNLVTTEDSLKIALYERLGAIMETEGMFPILHFSVHGDEDGIDLTDNTPISWYDLHHLIMPIQDILQQEDIKLLICMSSCYGSFAKEMAKIKEGKIPFELLIGNKDEVPWSDAAVAYITFYHLLFKGYDDIKLCVEIMKKASGNSNFVVYDGNKIHLNWIRRRQEKIRLLAGKIRRQGLQ